MKVVLQIMDLQGRVVKEIKKILPLMVIDMDQFNGMESLKVELSSMQECMFILLLRVFQMEKQLIILDD